MTRYRIAIDTGGTFTDVLLWDSQSGAIATRKVPSTPAHPEEAFLTGVAQLGVEPASIAFLGHGTTVAINTLVQRKGAPTGLITTAGFRDVLEIQRTNRPDMYNLFYRKPIPLVPRNLRLEATERMMADGTVQTPLDLATVRTAVETLRQQGVKALAICFLNAYINPAHEEAAAALVRAEYPDLEVTASCEVAREWREYERTATAVLNAYLTLSVRSYLGSLTGRMGEQGFDGSVLLTKSDGGLTLAESAGEQPVGMLMSGPAGGVLGAAEYGRIIEQPNLITFDIGGTTCDVSLIKDGQPLLVRDRLVEGYPVLAPFIDIHSIGAGGGTIAWADQTGMLRVGPHSAGAEPGPACYGRGGTEPTITDAYVILGLIDPSAFLGGKMPLNPDLAWRAFEGLAQKVGLSVEACARGALTILDHTMVAALRVVSIERGHDPRDFTLMAFGGAGALHLGSLGRELGMKRGLAPRYPSLFSAWGILAADIRHSNTRTLNRMTGEVMPAQLNELIGELHKEGAAQLDRDGVAADARHFALSMDMRYVGQEHSVNVPGPLAFNEQALRALVEQFHSVHEQAYTYRLPNDPALITNLRLDAIGRQPTPTLTPWPVQGTAADAWIGQRAVRFDAAEPLPTPIYARERLGVGVQLTGPCIVEEETSATVLLPGQTLQVDRFGNLLCDHLA